MTAQDDAALTTSANAGSATGQYRLNWDAPAAALRAVQTGTHETVAVDVWFTADDGATARQRVAWVARPRLTAATARVQAPDYAAGRVPNQSADLDPAGDTLSARTGSTVTLELTFNKALDASGDDRTDASGDDKTNASGGDRMDGANDVVDLEGQLMPALAALPDAVSHPARAAPRPTHLDPARQRR